jgi:hypothetical protein
MLKPEEKHCRIAAHGALALIAALILLTFRDYGVTWDEELQSQYGLAVVDYYLSLFQDHRFAEIFNLYIYGGMFDGLASVIDRFTPFSLYETRHLLNAAVGLTGLWGTWRLGRLLGGGAIGLMALVMLALTPMYYGHMFNNPKDIPFAAGVIWSLYYMGRCLPYKASAPRRLIVKLGLIYGLTLGVRVGGVMLLVFWVAVLGLDVVRAEMQYLTRTVIPAKAGIQRRASARQRLLCAVDTAQLDSGFRRNDADFCRGVLNVLHSTLPVALIAYAVMLLCWPWAQQNPIANPLRALSEFSNFPQDVEVLLDGVNYRSTQLPWFYVPLYFGVQLPAFLLALLAASIAVLPVVWKKFDRPRRQLLALMLLMAMFPILYAMLRHPALYAFPVCRADCLYYGRAHGAAFEHAGRRPIQEADNAAGRGRRPGFCGCAFHSGANHFYGAAASLRIYLYQPPRGRRGGSLWPL